MAFMLEVATGCGKLASGDGVPNGAVDATRVHALSVRASAAKRISANFFMFFFSSRRVAGFDRE
jgi:hypothetical protein